jgi:hypothetical protein
MPLKSGASQKTFVDNIREIMHSFHRTGRIGASRPSSAGKASKQAVAIAYRQKRKAAKKS